MPIFGLGLYRASSGKDTQNAVKWAFEAGYRMFDTAQIYQNEKDLGIALADLGVDRSEYFVTTKLWNSNQGEKTKSSLHESLGRLSLEYVDLFLMHWPVKEYRIQSWEYMIELQEEGLTKSIGVSNFLSWHLDELIDESDVMPTVNQVEFSPYLNRQQLLEQCQSQDIAFEAYSPLTKARKLNDPKLVDMAKKYDKTPAQILIRWVLDQDAIVIPKSTNRGRIRENINVFDFKISPDDLKEMSTWNEDLVTGWDPRNQK